MKCQVVFCKNEADHEEVWFYNKIPFIVMVCKEHCSPEEIHRPTTGAVDLLTCPQCEGDLHNGHCQECKAAFEPANH